MAKSRRIETFTAEHIFAIDGCMNTIQTWTGPAGEWAARGVGMAQGWSVIRDGAVVHAVRIVTRAGGRRRPPRYAAESLAPSLN